MGLHAERTRKLRELSLFSGAGGGLLASQWFKQWRTICYVEWDEYCQQVLQARIRDGFLHDAPIWGNVRTFDGKPWEGRVDVISAGFPCQPFSVAGKRKSSNDLRNGWPDTIRIIRQVQPRFVFLENVKGLLSAMDKTKTNPIFYFGIILKDLAESGYNARWHVLSASECGAPHKRERIWIMAYANSQRELQSKGIEQNQWGWTSNSSQEVCNTQCEKLERTNRAKLESRNLTRSAWWATEPQLGRLANGMADRVERIKALGNGQVPIVAATAWDLLIGDTK